MFEDIPATTSVHNRYQVGNETVGLYETTMTQDAAFRSMRRLLQRCPDEPAWVYDRHARRGSLQTWTYRIDIRLVHDGKPAYQYTVVSTKRRAI